MKSLLFSKLVVLLRPATHLLNFESRCRMHVRIYSSRKQNIVTPAMTLEPKSHSSPLLSCDHGKG